MLNRTAWLIAVTTGLLVTAGLDRAEADHKDVKGTFAGTFLDSRIDFFPLGKPDGIPAVWATSQGSGSLGKFTAQGVAEEVPTGPTQACPGGVFVIDAQHGGFGTFTVTYANGDQSYNELSTRTVCFDVVGGFTSSDTGLVVGGTGKFAGTSGTFAQSTTGFIQAFDANAKPAQGFGSFTGQFTGTLVFP
jgi:hypothetical protein